VVPCGDKETEVIFNIVVLVVFFALVTGIGIWGVRRTKTLGDFFLGGRAMGPWVSAFAYGTSYFSAVMVIGFAGTQGWQFGIKVLWIAAGNAFIGSMLAWIVLARRTRQQTQRLDAMTMPEYLQQRYGARHLKPIAASIIFLFLLPYSASIFKGLGHLFETVFHIPYDIALLLMIAFTGVYLILGGYFAIVVIDFIQGILMIAGAIAMVSVIVNQGGGLSASIASILGNYSANIPAAARPSVLTILSLVFMTSFGTWGLPQMTQKFYAIKNEAVIPRAVIACTIFAAIVGFSAYFVGSASHIFFTPESLPRLENGRINFDLIVPTLLVQHLPSFLIALILLFVLSASMSTLSSLVLISASSVAIDLYPVKTGAEDSKSRSTAMIRFLSLVFIIISYFISRFQIGIIVTLMSLSWGAVSGAFAAPYILGLYSKRVTKAGAYAGLIGGLIVEITLFFLLPGRSPLAASIAIIAPFLIVPAVSMFTKPPEARIIEKAFG
jgi:SSS family solute:Na+ symporter